MRRAAGTGDRNHGGAAASIQLGGRATLAEIEDEHLRRVLARAVRLDEAAAILGIDPATLYRKRRRMEAGGEGKTAA